MHKNTILLRKITICHFWPWPLTYNSNLAKVIPTVKVQLKWFRHDIDHWHTIGRYQTYYLTASQWIVNSKWSCSFDTFNQKLELEMKSPGLGLMIMISNHSRWTGPWVSNACEDLWFSVIHSFSKETQHFGSCLSFGEECIPVNLGLYIISTVLMVTTCQKPYFKIDVGPLTILNCLSTSHIALNPLVTRHPSGQN